MHCPKLAPILGGLLLLILLGKTISSNAQGFRLSSGQSATLEFTSLPNMVSVVSQSFVITTDIILPCLPFDPFCGPTIIPDEPVGTSTPPNQGLFLLTFGNDLLDPGESLTLDLFENSIAEVPFASQPFSGVGSSTIMTSGLVGWQDLQGIVRVTMNEGSVNLDRFSVVVAKDGVDYSGTTVVPEPSILSIGAIACLSAMCFYARRRQNSLP